MPILFGAFLVVLAVCSFSVNLSAQVVPKSISAGGSDAALRDQENAWTIGIVGGLFSGTYMRLVDEMASALNDGTICAFFRSSLTVPPPISTICSIFTEWTQQSLSPTCLNIFVPCARRRILSNVSNYIIRLPISELHILARDSVQSLEDLRGKKVNFGPPGTGRA